MSATSPIRPRLLAALAVVAVAVSLLATPTQALPVDRGAGRMGTAAPATTALDIATMRFPSGGAGAIVLARDDAFADSLAGTALLRNAAMLLTPGDHLPDDIATAIGRTLRHRVPPRWHRCAL